MCLPRIVVLLLILLAATALASPLFAQTPSVVKIGRSGDAFRLPDAWNGNHALSVLAGAKPVPEHFEVTWSVVPHFADEVAATAVTVAQGLPNAKHTLELGGPATVRIHIPPMK